MSRQYGPHRPEDNTTGYVTVRRHAKSLERVTVPLSPAVARQRQQLNDKASR